MVEQSFDLVIAHALHEVRFDEGRLPSAGDDLPHHPLQILVALLRPRQDIDRALERHGAEPLQTPPYLDAQVFGLPRKLMQEEKPTRLVASSHRETDVSRTLLKSTLRIR